MVKLASLLSSMLNFKMITELKLVHRIVNKFFGECKRLKRQRKIQGK